MTKEQLMAIKEELSGQENEYRREMNKLHPVERLPYATAVLVLSAMRAAVRAAINVTIDDEVETSIEEYRREHGFNPEDLKGLPVYKPKT